MKKPFLNLVLFLTIIISSTVFGEVGNVIPDLTEYLDANASGKTPYEKLELISEIKKNRKLKGVSHNHIIRGLIFENVFAKENNTALKRLKAYENANRLSGIDYIASLQSVLINEVLITDKNYQSADIYKKLEILISLDKNQKTGTRFFVPEMKRILFNEIYLRTKNINNKDKGLIILKFYSELSERNIKSGWFGISDEIQALSQHLVFSKKFNSLENAEKIKYLNNLYPTFRRLGTHSFEFFYKEQKGNLFY